MACSCRTSALRIFVRSLTEVYTPPPPNTTLARTAAWHDTRPRVNNNPSTHTTATTTTTRVGVSSCRQIHASARAYNSAQDGAGDAAPAEAGATAEQHATGVREEQKSAQQVEDDILFEIKIRSRNARKKARKYPDATKKPVVAGVETGTGVDGQEGREIHEVREVQHAQEAQEAQEARPVQQSRQSPQAREGQQVREIHEVHEAQDVQQAQEIHEVHEAQGVQQAQGAHGAQEVQETQKNRFAGVSKIVVDETRGSKHTTRGAYFEGRFRKEDKPQIPERVPVAPETKPKDSRPLWAIQKEALRAKFPEGWQPRKKLSPDALSGIRALNQQFPAVYTTKALSDKFQVSPEAIRRILRARWEPTDDQDEDRQRRWFNRGLSVWERYAELGKTPPRRWRNAGVEARPWSERRWEDDEEAEEEEREKAAENDANEERLRRLKTQVKLAKSLM